MSRTLAAAPRIALVTAIAHAALDEDLPPLLAACAETGLVAEVRAWDDGSVSWARYDAAVLRSPWDYVPRLGEFLDWCVRTAARTRLINPLPLVHWNTDKHYLGDLHAAGIAVVPGRFVETDAEPLPALEAFLAAFPEARTFVVKPCVGTSSRDAQRYDRDQVPAAADHLGRLLLAGRSAMLQPYLAAVDARGETGLIYLDGAFSHAIRKAALLRPQQTGAGPTSLDHTQLPGAIAARSPAPDELALAETALAAVRARSGGENPLYARVDLLHAEDGTPRLLELELTEPSLFFDTAPGAAARFAEALARRLSHVQD